MDFGPDEPQQQPQPPGGLGGGRCPPLVSLAEVESRKRRRIHSEVRGANWIPFGHVELRADDLDNNRLSARYAQSRSRIRGLPAQGGVRRGRRRYPVYRG